jgi:organic radical activating enzyme
MFGQNPKLPPVKSDGEHLDVHSIFYTLQGEGPRAGQPAVFVRLSGCNLACDFCDTDFDAAKKYSIAELLEKIEQEKQFAELIVITGGEPLRQEIAKFCNALIAKNFTVQIETNGTLYQNLPTQVEWVCSPKASASGYGALRQDVVSRVTAFKFLLSKTHPLYLDVPKNNFTAPIYVQPMDEKSAEKNQANLVYATKMAMKRGYRLSLQLHKYIGIP